MSEGNGKPAKWQSCQDLADRWSDGFGFSAFPEHLKPELLSNVLLTAIYREVRAIRIGLRHPSVEEIKLREQVDRVNRMAAARSQWIRRRRHIKRLVDNVLKTQFPGIYLSGNPYSYLCRGIYTAFGAGWYDQWRLADRDRREISRRYTRELTKQPLSAKTLQQLKDIGPVRAVSILKWLGVEEDAKSDA